MTSWWYHYNGKAYCSCEESVVLSRLRLKPSKCKSAQKEIKYLGFTLSPEGVKPDSLKT